MHFKSLLVICLNVDYKFLIIKASFVHSEGLIMVVLQIGPYKNCYLYLHNGCMFCVCI